MSRISIPFAGIDASAYGYGRTRRCPDFGVGQAAYMLGTSLTDTPTKNLFTDALDGRLIGTPQALGLVGGPAATAFSGTITGGNLLTVTGVVSGDQLVAGQTLELATGLGGALGTILPFGTSGTTGIGGAGTYAISGAINTATASMRAWTAFLEFPTIARDLFNISSALTLWAIYQSGISQTLLADDTNAGSLGILVGNTNEIQTFGRDSAAVVLNTSTSSAYGSSSSVWTMGFSEFDTTTANGFIRRLVGENASATVGPRTANPVGSTTRKLRTHHYYTATPSARIVGVGVHRKKLIQAERDDLFSYWKDILADVNQNF